MKLSLCMIVKNEEDCLARCLQSVASLVDEMIVVDTGSTDGTVEIAKECGATVYADEWHDDFSKARNASLEKATGDWILVMDADEEFCSEDTRVTRELLDDETVKGYLVKIVSCSMGDENPAKARTHRNIRLFRNSPHHRYEGIIHEEIDLDHDASLAIGEAAIKIFHYGYDDATDKKKKRRADRNKELLESALADDPNDATLNFYMGEKSFNEGKWEEALARFKTARANFAPGGYLQPFTAQNIISSLIEMGRLETALEEVIQAHKHYPNYSEFYYFEGEIFTKVGQHGRALKCFKRCVARRYLPAVRSHETRLHDDAMFGVGICSIQLGFDQQAIEAFTDCLRVNPSDTVALDYLGQLLIKTSEPLNAKAKLGKMVDSTDPAVAAILQKLF